MPIEIEAETLSQLDEALSTGADTILVDNMSTADIRECVARAKGRARIEISGGVTLERIPELAATGADFVSVGALTHPAPAVDISFESNRSRRDDGNAEAAPYGAAQVAPNGAARTGASDDAAPYETASRRCRGARRRAPRAQPRPGLASRLLPPPSIDERHRSHL